jgi:hypothetical protein
VPNPSPKSISHLKYLTNSIRGSKPHCSNDDPTDEQDVISIRLLDEKDNSLASIHVHQDGTSKKVTWR